MDYQDGKEIYLLFHDLEVQCWTTNHFSIIFLLAVPILLLYVVGIPALLYGILRNNKELARYVIAKNEGLNQPALKTMPLPGTSEEIESFNKAFSFSFAGYEPDYFWWEVVIISRKSMISMTGVLLSRDPLGQSVVMSVILCLSLVAHSIASPFTADWADRFERSSLFSSFFLFSFGALTIGDSPMAKFASPAALLILGGYVVYAFLILLQITVLKSKKIEPLNNSEDEAKHTRVTEETYRNTGGAVELDEISTGASIKLKPARKATSKRPRLVVN